jgi:hypothetical protein
MQRRAGSTANELQARPLTEYGPTFDCRLAQDLRQA